MQSGWSRSIITSSRIRSFSRSRSPKKRQLTSPSELRVPCGNFSNIPYVDQKPNGNIRHPKQGFR
eukprot:1394989-Amorphochlora_amoeboformis.AAC.1